jgi:hypothetical protein
VRCEVIFFHWCPWVNVLLRIPRHRAAEPGGRTRLLAPSIARCKMGLTWYLSVSRLRVNIDGNSPHRGLYNKLIRLQQTQEYLLD